ncbi:BT0820 family HAD-type phosphatase [Olleya sp. 1-3]|uniref:BT0820 family HAD-type phosphatase n=1 Tax=Olleya sp. 1-3 TaxID=2058323 RepID=UPI000C32FB82|nr:hydrolase [Olleya sp. 1-3]PKG50655.1 hydrolase [Olleya sp. 1-3]
MKLSKGLIIAVDFDGTIVEDGYPGIGQERLFAFETLKRLQADGHRLILWTYRHGKKLDEAVTYCQDNGITFYAVNQSFPEEDFKNDVSRKIHADLFIDDRNIGGILGWGAIYQMLTNDTPQLPKPKKKSWFKF